MRNLVLTSALAMAPSLSHAQVPAVLGKCIIASLSASDRQDLARWVFLSMSVHPAVKPLASANAEATQAAARKVGALFTRTIRDSCPAEAKDAARAGEQPIVSSAINFFTQLGVQELMIDRDVLSTHASFGQFADKEGIDRATRGR